jgi:hypothetical protein
MYPRGCYRNSSTRRNATADVGEEPRARITFWELLAMLKLATLGPESLERDYVDPLTELEQLRRHAVRDARLLGQPNCSLADGAAVLRRVRRYFELLAEHHPDPQKRAAAEAEFHRSEQGMARLAERQRRRIASS